MGNQEGQASHGLRVIVCIKFDSSAPADEVTELKRRLIEDRRSVHSVDLLGSFDFMMEVALPDLAIYQEWIGDFSDAFARLVENHETNFICRRYVRDVAGPIQHLWVSGDGGRIRLECDQIEHFSAEGDYVRAHGGDRSWLISSSLTKLEDQLDAHEFIRLHRSTIARRDAIVRLSHQGRTWLAELTSGATLRIAKSHVADVLHLIRDDPSAPHAISATGEPLGEKSAALVEE